MPRSLTAAAVAVLALATGCSSDGSSEADPTPDPTQATSSSTSPSPGAPANKPVVLRTYPGFSSCEILDGKLLEVGSMRVTRPVTLEGASLVGAVNINLDETSVARRPDGTKDSAGSYPGAAPGAKLAREIGWDQRRPLAGAQLQPGRYYYFLPVEVDEQGGHYDGMEVAWSEGDQGGVSDAERVTDFKKSCR
jgi:hypothetical protein